MSYANQIIAWTKGCFDGIEKRHEPNDQGSHFVWLGITKSSVEARCRYLRGYAEEAKERIEGLRTFGLERPHCSGCGRKLSFSDGTWRCYLHGVVQ